jgi:hypothetical protein
MRQPLAKAKARLAQVWCSKAIARRAGARRSTFGGWNRASAADDSVLADVLGREPSALSFTMWAVIVAAHTPTIKYIAAWATVGTPIGTIALATATLVLAGNTQRLAQSGQETADAANEELVFLRTQTDAAQRQSRAAEEALIASVVPVLLDTPRYTMFQVPKKILERLGYRSPLGPPVPSEIDLSIISANDSATFPSLVVPVRNMGAGVALGLAAAVTIEAMPTPIARGEPPSAIAVGGHGHVWCGAQRNA